jgi:hypothetical protein
MVFFGFNWGSGHPVDRYGRLGLLKIKLRERECVCQLPNQVAVVLWLDEHRRCERERECVV